MADVSISHVVVLLLAICSCDATSFLRRTDEMTIVNVNGKLFLKTHEDTRFPVKCFHNMSDKSEIRKEHIQTVRIEEHLFLLVDTKTRGLYWCEDENGVSSNSMIVASVLVGLELPTPGSSTLGYNSDMWYQTSAYKERCPEQTITDETGRAFRWPSVSLGETYIMYGNNCVQSVRICVSNPNLTLVEPKNWRSDFPPCPRIQTNLTTAANQLKKIAKKAVVTADDLSTAIDIVNKALQINRTVLYSAKQETASVVQGLDTVLTRVRLHQGESVYKAMPKVSVYVLNVELEQPRGIALKKSSKDMTESSVITFKTEQELTSKEEEVETVIILPKIAVTNDSNTHIALAFYNDDDAFRDDKWHTNSHIVSINSEGINSVQIMFKPLAQIGDKRCVFWDFNQSGGSWSDYGCELVPAQGFTHDLCRCSHLTHFAEVISPAGSMELDPVLDMISLVGCSLSLLGLLGIFMTGAIFWQWRAQLGNKILLHLSAAVAMNMIVFLLVATGLVVNMCVPLGALLHYSILTSFCWMLVCAGLQFMRLVSVLGTQYISHLLIKASIFAWGAPLLPVSTLLIINTELYKPNGQGLCYPEGLAFYLAVLCPVVMIVVINLIIFGTILHRLFESSSIQRHVQSERKLILRRFLTSLLLFFLLGLTWVFGLVASFSKVFAYLFCLTATMQGFVLFLFFVFGEKKTRRYWTGKTSTQKHVSTTTTSTERVALRRREET